MRVPRTVHGQGRIVINLPQPLPSCSQSGYTLRHRPGSPIPAMISGLSGQYQSHQPSRRTQVSEQLLSTTSGWPVVRETLPDTMTAVVFEEFGAPEVLQMTQLSTPRPGPGEVVVRVAAVSVGRLLDLTARAGTHPYARFTLPHVLGADHAGTVAAVGAGVGTVSVGDHVAVFPVLSCGHCAACSEGAIEACPEARIMGVHVQGPTPNTQWTRQRTSSVSPRDWTRRHRRHSRWPARSPRTNSTRPV